jgi:hypothetical protein
MVVELTSGNSELMYVLEVIVLSERATTGSE